MQNFCGSGQCPCKIEIKENTGESSRIIARMVGPMGRPTTNCRLGHTCFSRMQNQKLICGLQKVMLSELIGLCVFETNFYSLHRTPVCCHPSFGWSDGWAPTLANSSNGLRNNHKFWKELREKQQPPNLCTHTAVKMPTLRSELHIFHPQTSHLRMKSNAKPALLEETLRVNLL